MKGRYVIGVCIKMQTPYPLDHDLSLRSLFLPLGLFLSLCIFFSASGRPPSQPSSPHGITKRRQRVGSGLFFFSHLAQSVHGGRSDLVEFGGDVSESAFPKYRDPWSKAIQISESFNCSNDSCRIATSLRVLDHPTRVWLRMDV